jgi:hypothetical protein
MQNHTQTRNTVQSGADVKPERRQEALLQRIDVMDLQQTVSAHEAIPIIHRLASRSGVPFSALND